MTMREHYLKAYDKAKLERDYQRSVVKELESLRERANVFNFEAVCEQIDEQLPTEKQALMTMCFTTMLIRVGIHAQTGFYPEELREKLAE